MEARSRHQVVDACTCQGRLRIAFALAALQLPNLEKLTLSRIHLTDGHKLAGFSARHNATLKEIVIEQCMLSEAFTSWDYILVELGRSGCMPEKLVLDGLFQDNEAYVEQRVEEGQQWTRPALFERDTDAGTDIRAALGEFAVSIVGMRECNALPRDVKYMCVLFKAET
jgi:hypothetical protein